MFMLLGMAHRTESVQVEIASYHAYRVVIHGIFALLVVFVFFGDRIVWPNCLSGLAWRYWLLLYCVAAWLTVFGVTPRLNESTPR